MKVFLLALIPAFAVAQPFRWYQAPTPVAPLSFQNSGRLESLMRAGKVYLSLPDAIALALENNLDVELQRTLPRIAGTDVQRASGGGPASCGALHPLRSSSARSRGQYR